MKEKPIECTSKMKYLQYGTLTKYKYSAKYDLIYDFIIYTSILLFFIVSVIKLILLNREL